MLNATAIFPKLGLFDGKSQIINIEIGKLRLCPGRIDREYFDSTKQPEQYHLEKMISGAYLGPLSTLVIQKAIAEGVLSSTFPSALRSWAR